MPTEEEAAQAYPEAYAVHPAEGSKGLFGLLRVLEWRVLFENVYRRGAQSVIGRSGLRAGDLLEVGCSSGYQLLAYQSAGEFVVTGVDVDGEAVRHARGVLGLTARQGRLEDCAFLPESFDLVVLFNVLEHLLFPNAVLKEISRVLRPGGFLAIKVPNADSLQRRVFGRRWQILCEAPRHVMIPSKLGIKRLLSEAGLSLRETFPAPAMENSVSMALSIYPAATTHLLRQRVSRVRRFLGRLLGLAIGAVVIPLAYAENALGPGGTLIHLAQKPVNVGRAQSSTGWDDNGSLP
jgi:SAM-dependent methyltransferase